MKLTVRYSILLLLVVMGKAMMAQFDAVHVDVVINKSPGEKYHLKTYYKFFDNKYMLSYEDYQVRNSEYVLENVLDMELSKEVFNRIAKCAIGISSSDLLLRANTNDVIIIDDCGCVVSMKISVNMERSVYYSMLWPSGKQSIQGISAPYQIQKVIQKMCNLVGIDYKQVLNGYYIEDQ